MFIKLRTYDGAEMVLNTDKIGVLYTTYIGYELVTKIDFAYSVVTTHLTLDAITEAICSGVVYADLTDRA